MAPRLIVLLLGALALASAGCTSGAEEFAIPAEPDLDQAESSAEPRRTAAEIEQAINDRRLPDVVGWDLNTLGDGTGLLYRLHEAVGVQVTRWVASEAGRPGTIVAQQPAPETAFEEVGQWTLEVSEGGPVIGFDDLPNAVAEFGATLAGFDVDELLIARQTEHGMVYKSDQWLFGLNCSAVDAAYRTFLDGRYTTACPGAIERPPPG